MKQKTYKLDPAIEKQLFASPTEFDARVQELLDNILPVHVDTIEYLPNEIPVRSEKEKRSVFDVICTNKTTKEKFLCEMQRLPESDMDDRLLFYGCPLIQKLIKRKDKKYNLNTVYVICVADYERSHPAAIPSDDFLFHYRLKDEKWPEDIMSSKLQFYYLELPRLQKGWDATQTNAERWCYLFRNLYKFAGIPHDASDFEPIFEIARTEQFDEEQLKVYLSAMVTDYKKLVIGEYHEQKGFKEGLERGREEKAVDTAIKMLARGYEVSEIVALTELSPDEISAIAKEMEQAS